MKEYGGFFGLELNKEEEFHSKAFRLNSGRNCLSFLLKLNQYSRIFLPYFVCESLHDSSKRKEIDIVFYHIDSNLEPILNLKDLTEQDVLLFPNYFSLKSKFIQRLAKSDVNLIIDNAQAFFVKPLSKIDTLYSPRKFFGVSDGAYLYSHNDKSLKYYEELPRDFSMSRFSHLLGRIEQNAKKSYESYKLSEDHIGSLPEARMSSLTQRILSSIDYETVKRKRLDNFLYIHEELQEFNELKDTINLSGLEGPMCYPLLKESRDLKQKLINEKIYIPTYWDHLKSLEPDSFENYLRNGLVCLPIDQRYTLEDMMFIVQKVKASIV